MDLFLPIVFEKTMYEQNKMIELWAKIYCIKSLLDG